MHLHRGGHRRGNHRDVENMTQKFIRETLARAGVGAVVSGQQLAKALRISPSTVRMAKMDGRIRQVDRDTYELEAVVDWLMAQPRYLTKIV